MNQIKFVKQLYENLKKHDKDFVASSSNWGRDVFFGLGDKRECIRFDDQCDYTSDDVVEIAQLIIDFFQNDNNFVETKESK